MLKKLNYKFLFATALAFGLINSIELQLPSRYSGARLEFGNASVAKGSRSSSSSSSSSSSRSSSSSSSSSRSSSSSSSSSRSSSSSSSRSRSSPSTTTTSPARASSSAPSSGSTGGRVSGGSFKKPAPSSNPIRSQTTTKPSQSTSSQRQTLTNPPKPTSSRRQTTRPYTSYPSQGSRHIDIDIEIENDNSAPYPAYPVAPNTAPIERTGTAAPPASTVQSCGPDQTLPSDSNLPQCNLNPTTPSSSTTGSKTTTTAPATATESANSSDNGVASFISWGLAALFLLSLSAAVILLVYFILKQKKAGSTTNERENDIVTVSQLQVALLATAQGLQSELSELTLMADTETSEGLSQLLQESVLVLLRNSHNWTHVLTSSQSVRSREEAEVLFTKLSIEQRSKFSAETLAHVRGKVNHKDVASHDTFEVSADYIVVTLLVGTADDKPLFGEIRSVEALKDALQKVASIPSDYLMSVELLWSPQKETDTLTYEQLLTNYTDMFQIS